MSASFSPNQSRLLLSFLRGGEYVHAGDKAAVEMVLSKVLDTAPHIQEGPVLDVGSGFGKTADDIYHAGFREVWGIDKDASAVHYAQRQYPSTRFLVENALSVEECFPPSYFSFITMFNVLYSISEKQEVLKSLCRIAKPGAVLVLFDYSTKEMQDQLLDLTGKPMYPVQFEKIRLELVETGWNILEVMDLSSQFIQWYEVLLNKLRSCQEVLLHTFSQEDMDKLQITFTSILSQLKAEQMGGIVIYALKSNGS